MAGDLLSILDKFLPSTRPTCTELYVNTAGTRHLTPHYMFEYQLRKALNILCKHVVLSRMNGKENQAFSKTGATETNVKTLHAECRPRIGKSSRISRQASGPGQTSPSEAKQPYERRFSIIQRFGKLVTSPSEAMEDVALFPDYSGPITIVVLEVIFLTVYLGLALQRFSFTGASATSVSELWGTVVTTFVAIVAVGGSILYVIFWLVKSLLVRTFSDSGSGWEFKTAASVTGYAYIADLVVLAIDIVIVLSFMPTISISTSLSRSEIAAQVQSQIGWIRIFSVPFGLLAQVWKSYLGGLGAHHGTEEKCTVGKGFAVFFVLGLIGWAIDFLVRGF